MNNEEILNKVTNLKSSIEGLKQSLASLKGQRDAVKSQAKEQFGVDTVDTLKTLKESIVQKVEALVAKNKPAIEEVSQGLERF